MGAHAGLLVALALCITVAQAQTVPKTLAAAKYFTLFNKLVVCAGAETALSNTQAVVTVLAPTDKAIKDFLAASGIDPTTATTNRELCRTVLSYHIIPTKVTVADIKKPDAIAPTVLEGNFVRLTATKGPKVAVIVKDEQGNVGNVTKCDIIVGKATIHHVDRVLLSKKVFVSVADSFKFYTSKVSGLEAALKKAGLWSTLTTKGFVGTVFAPNNAALTAARASSLPTATLKDVLLYHVLPETKTVPSSFEKDKKYETLFKKHFLGLVLKLVPVKVGPLSYSAVQASVVPEVGAPAVVKVNNVFAGKAVLHGISSVLLPSSLAPTTTAEKAPLAASGRKMLQARFAQQNADFEADMAEQSATVRGAAQGYTSASSATPHSSGGSRSFVGTVDSDW